MKQAIKFNKGNKKLQVIDLQITQNGSKWTQKNKTLIWFNEEEDNKMQKIWRYAHRKCNCQSPNGSLEVFLCETHHWLGSIDFRIWYE